MCIVVGRRRQRTARLAAGAPSALPREERRPLRTKRGLGFRVRRRAGGTPLRREAAQRYSGRRKRGPLLDQWLDFP